MVKWRLQSKDVWLQSLTIKECFQFFWEISYEGRYYQWLLIPLEIWWKKKDNSSYVARVERRLCFYSVKTSVCWLSIREDPVMCTNWKCNITIKHSGEKCTTKLGKKRWVFEAEWIVYLTNVKECFFPWNEREEKGDCWW